MIDHSDTSCPRPEATGPDPEPGSSRGRPKSKSVLRMVIRNDKNSLVASDYHFHGGCRVEPDAQRLRFSCRHELDAASEHDDAETLAVWAFRRWVLGLRQGSEQWHTVWRGLQRRCGEAAGREATAAMAEMIEELRRTARRPSPITSRAAPASAMTRRLCSFSWGPASVAISCWPRLQPRRCRALFMPMT